MQLISPVASHSRVQDLSRQRTGSWIENYGTKVSEDNSDQQSAADEMREQIAV